jgi:hypothetical protein
VSHPWTNALVARLLFRASAWLVRGLPCSVARSLPRSLALCSGDWDVYETTPWCVSRATRCTNAARDALAAPSTAASGSECEHACEEVPACSVYTFSPETGACALLRSCGTPAQAADARDYAGFRPGNVERGCTDRTAQNFNSFAVYDDGSCT